MNLSETQQVIDPVAKYLKHLVAESSKPLPALGLMLDCRLKFNCLITGAILTGRNRPVNTHNGVVNYNSKIHARFNYIFHGAKMFKNPMGFLPLSPFCSV
jgi:hypothetical protein